MTETSRDQLSKTVQGIREIYESYESVCSINPKQDPGFVIKHLEKHLGKEENISVKLENGGGDKRVPQNDILAKIQILWNVYKTLCKNNVDDAPAILIRNLGQVLSMKEEDPKPPAVHMEFSPKEEENDFNFKIVTTQSLSSAVATQCGDTSENFDQHPLSIPNSSMYLQGEVEEKQQKEEQKGSKTEMKKTRLYYQCQTCSKLFRDKTKYKNHRRLHKQDKKNPFFCKFCKTTFPHKNLRSIHQDFCLKSPLNKNIKSLSIKQAKRNRPPPPSSSSTNTITEKKEGSNELSTTNSQFPNSSPVYDQSEPMRTNIGQIISTETKKTLISFGHNPSSFPSPRNRACHLCQGKNFITLERLANHLRSIHSKERDEPFHCFHPKCVRRFTNSTNFRKHLTYPHMENGTFSIPRRSMNLKISHPKSQTPNTRIINKKFTKRRNPLKTRRGGSNKKFIYCDCKLSSASLLRRHVRIHTGECPFSCLKCPMKFTRQDRLKQQEERFHKDELAMDIYDKNSKSSGSGQNKSSTLNSALNNLDNHYTETTRGHETQVELLPVIDWPWAQQENHNDKIEDEGLDEQYFENDSHNSDSDDDDQLRNFNSSSSSSSPPHSPSREIMNENTSKTRYSCVQCTRSYFNRGHLFSHGRRHLTEEEERNPLTCIICKQQLCDRESRLQHQKMEHSTNGYYRCEICRSKFLNVFTFVAHRNYMHSF